MKVKSLIALIVLAAAGAAVYDYVRYIYVQPLSPGRETVLTLARGESFAAVATKVAWIVAGAPVFFPRTYIRIYGRLGGVERRIKAGEYAVGKEMTISALLGKIVRGESIYRNITVPEGARFADLLRIIGRHPGITLNDDALRRIRLQFPDTKPPEGWFFPDTYLFHGGSDGFEILKKSHLAMRRILQKHWQTRNPTIPLNSPYEALILASIIEKEAKLAEEKTEIAAVFLNRLKQNMPLEADPTVIYGLGENFDGNLTRADLRADTPYNTYTRRALPPTPIALPGEQAIYAATHPTTSSALYFVAKGDGSHHFSQTYKEHKQMVDKYQRNRKK